MVDNYPAQIQSCESNAHIQEPFFDSFTMHRQHTPNTNGAHALPHAQRGLPEARQRLYIVVPTFHGAISLFTFSTGRSPK